MTCTLAWSVAGVLLVALDASAQVTINEIRTDDPGSDNSEHFELKGPASGSLAGLTYLVIGDGTGGSGVIEEVVDVSNFTLDVDGLLDIASNDSSNVGALPFCGGDWTLWGPANINFENNDNVTHMLVADFTGVDGQDLDADDDGTLDTMPWTQIVDSVALIHSTTSSELVYSATQVGPDGGVQPAHVYYCESSGWLMGQFGPECGTDTPGEPNSGCVGTSVADPLALRSWGRAKALYR
jgi:hypothetical protein